jgi:hypothetical protein
MSVVQDLVEMPVIENEKSGKLKTEGWREGSERIERNLMHKEDGRKENYAIDEKRKKSCKGRKGKDELRKKKNGD